MAHETNPRFAPDYFGEEVARAYDQSSAAMFAPAVVDPVVDFLAILAGEGAALEMGIGTGRIALPLARRGVRVHGIELSAAMAAQLRQKPGGEQIGITLGDFSAASAPGKYSLVYLVFNTIMNLTTQDAQVACFQNAAAHLLPGGKFVIETLLPDLRRLPPGHTVQPFRFTASKIGLDEIDPATQSLTSHHFSLVDGNWRLRSIPFRYVWPAELDLMARIADMKLHQRWAGWKREPFTRDSSMHVSVWEKM